MIYHAALPALTIVITSLGGWILGMRNTMISTLGDDYVTFAEANGLKPRTVALRYAARNAILPNLTSFGLALGGVVGGSILVERVFGYPGVGYHMRLKPGTCLACSSSSAAQKMRVRSPTSFATRK